jgi:hypothetical protein
MACLLAGPQAPTAQQPLSCFPSHRTLAQNPRTGPSHRPIAEPAPRLDCPPVPPSPPRCSSDDDVLAVVAASLPLRCKLAVFDFVTSNTALLLPVQQLVAMCRARCAAGLRRRRLPAGLLRPLSSPAARRGAARAHHARPVAHGVGGGGTQLLSAAPSWLVSGPAHTPGPAAALAVPVQGRAGPAGRRARAGPGAAGPARPGARLLCRQLPQVALRAAGQRLPLAAPQPPRQRAAAGAVPRQRRRLHQRLPLGRQQGLLGAAGGLCGAQVGRPAGAWGCCCAVGMHEQRRVRPSVRGQARRRGI